MPIRLNDIETTFRLKANQALETFDKILAAEKQVDAKFKGLQKTFDTVGKNLAISGAAITATFAFAIRAAEQDDQAFNQLRATVDALGGGFEQNRGKIDAFVKRIVESTRFTDDEAVPALNRLVLATGDLDQALTTGELAIKLAAAGFGDIESNAVILARALEGNVQALGRFLPEFRNVEERLASGASRAELLAEGFDKLNKVANELEPPSGLNLMTKSFGELQEAIGRAANQGLDPFFRKLAEGSDTLRTFFETDLGRALATITALGGGLAGAAGSFILFAGNIVTAGAKLIEFAKTTQIVQKAIAGLTLAFTGPGGIVAALIVAGIALAAFSIVMDEVSKAADEARDKLFQSDRVSQFTTEIQELNAAIGGLESDVLSAGEAQKTFNKFGVANLEQAKQRVEVLGRVVQRLEDEKGATDGLTDSQIAAARAKEEQERIEKLLSDRAKERLDQIRLEIIETEKLTKAIQGFIDAGALPAPEREAPREDFTNLDALQQLDTSGPLASFVEPGSLEFILEDLDVFIEKTGTIQERVAAIAETEAGAKLAEEFRLAQEAAAGFDRALLDIAAGGFIGIADGFSNLFADLALDFNNAAENAKKFFKQLLADLIRAISKALILNAIISALPGGGFLGGVGNALRSLFQDPGADQLARFEGSRFTDLFFQGMFREFSTSRDRLDLALADNREIVRSNNKSMTAIVNEATPETTVEFTDRRVEPRVRERARQRSSRGNLSGAEIDRLIGDHTRQLDELRRAIG